MTDAASRSAFHDALARALAPPAGDAEAFLGLGLEEPDALALAAEHAALVGRGGRAVVSPYEGAHRSAPPQEVAAAYAAEGLALDPTFRDRPDHVSAELAVLSALERRRDRAVRSGDRDRARRAWDAVRGFFLGRVRPWVPDFLDAVRGVAGFPLHRALAERALEVVRDEAGRVAESGGVGPAPAAPALEEPLCTACGRPMGFAPPRRRNDFLPTWDLVCATCRIRADVTDLRRPRS